MNYSLFPIGGPERELPIFVLGVGLNDFQYDIIRDEGYYCHQVLYCTRGKGRVVINGKETIILPNMCFFLPANCPHEYYTIGDLWETHWISFDGYVCEKLLKTLGLDIPQVFTFLQIDSLEEIFQKIYTILSSSKPSRDYVASGYLYEFLLELHRLATETDAGTKKNKSKSLIPVLSYIDEHFTEDIELKVLASIAGVTPQCLCSKFKKSFLLRPVEYIAKKRIQLARNLLTSTNMSVAEIAEKVGYPDKSYFSLTFKKNEGISPTEYRKKYGNSHS